MREIPIQIILLLASFATTVVWGILALPMLKKLKVGQNIRDDGPESHLKKAGTPSMGGIIFLIPFTIIILLLAHRYDGMAGTVLSMLAAIVLFALVGFADDYIKVVKKRSTGLLAWQKMLLLLIISGGFAYYVQYILKIGTETYIPILRQYVDLGMFFIPFVMLVLISTTNVVNITEIRDDKKLPQENTLAGELNNKIIGAIHSLPEPFRIAIVLRELQGLSYDEIADITNTSVGTIKSRIARARSKLQENLRPYLLQ